jgi:hypothetical protein
VGIHLYFTSAKPLHKQFASTLSCDSNNCNLDFVGRWFAHTPSSCSCYLQLYVGECVDPAWPGCGAMFSRPVLEANLNDFEGNAQDLRCRSTCGLQMTMLDACGRLDKPLPRGSSSWLAQSVLPDGCHTYMLSPPPFPSLSLFLNEQDNTLTQQGQLLVVHRRLFKAHKIQVCILYISEHASSVRVHKG